jgi:hypothetical protein
MAGWQCPGVGHSRALDSADGLLYDDFANCTLDHGEPDLDHQPSLRSVCRSDFAVMELYRTLGNCQAQPNAASSAATSVIDTVKGTEKLIQRFFRNARTRIRDSYDCFCAICSLHALQANFDRCVFLGVAHCVAYDILDRTIQECGISHNDAVVNNRTVDSTMPALRLESGVLGNFTNKLVEVNRHFPQRLTAALQSNDG